MSYNGRNKLGRSMYLLFFEKINYFFTLSVVFPAIVLLGGYFTFKLKGLQISKFFLGCKLLFKKDKNAKGDISHFEAVSSVLASNFGTGNIAGMAVALAVGGPGACVWMWVMTFFGMILQFANCMLGVKYRQRNEKGEYVGGPMYYLANGLGWKKIAKLFAFFVIFASFTCGLFTQANSIALPLESIGVPSWVTGIVLAFLVGIVVIKGATRIAKVSSAIVPVMAVLYFGACLTVLLLNFEQVLPAIKQMFFAAFGMKQFAGGLIGFTLIKSLTTGFDRAIFATDAGTGTVPLLQSSAKTTDPVIDGLISFVAPIMVMIVCTMTALVLMVTGAFSTDLQSTHMVTYAFSHGLSSQIGLYIVLVSLFLFGYTTIIAWASCLQKAVSYLTKGRGVTAFLWLYTLITPLGAIMHIGLAWILADIALTSMLVINLVALCGLSKEVISTSNSYFSIPQKALIESEKSLS